MCVLFLFFKSYCTGKYVANHSFFYIRFIIEILTPVMAVLLFNLFVPDNLVFA